MKRIIALCLVAVLCLSLAACTQESKYADLEKMLDEGRYGEALTYILSLQAQNSSSVPLFGVVQPDDDIYSDEDLDANKEPSAEVLALIDALMGEWAPAGNYEDMPGEVILRADGTCTIDDKDLTWKLHTYDLDDDWEMMDLLSVLDGETEVYRITKPSTTDAGETYFYIGEVNGLTIGYNSTCRYIRSDSYEIIELTKDNWQKYFEFVETPYVKKNEFGDITKIGRSYAFVLKESYYNRLSKLLKSNGNVELSFTNFAYTARTSKDGLSYTVGEFHREYSGQRQEIYTLDEGYGNLPGWGVGYASGYAYSYDTYNDAPAPNSECFCYHVKNTTVLRIQGTLYFVKAQ